MDSFVRKYGRYVPFALTIIIIICCALFLKDHEFSEILSYCPDNLWLAAFVILGFYGFLCAWVQYIRSGWAFC